MRGAAARVERETPGRARARAAEQAVASLQGVLRRTANAQAEAEASGKTGIGCRELRLVQSVDDLLAPKVMEGAEVTWLEDAREGLDSIDC